MIDRTIFNPPQVASGDDAEPVQLSPIPGRRPFSVFDREDEEGDDDHLRFSHLSS